MRRCARQPRGLARLPLSLLVSSLLMAGVLAASTGVAGDHPGEPFSEARFEALQAEGALILVDVAAPWCPTCARQAALISRYRAERPDVALHVLRVDYDRQKEWVRFFGAPRQSTLLLYRGNDRLWLKVAETRERELFAAIDAGVRS